MRHVSNLRQEVTIIQLLHFGSHCLARVYELIAVYHALHNTLDLTLFESLYVFLDEELLYELGLASSLGHQYAHRRHRDSVYLGYVFVHHQSDHGLVDDVELFHLSQAGSSAPLLEVLRRCVWLREA